jgi:hypothetical protein
MEDVEAEISKATRIHVFLVAMDLVSLKL